MISARGPSPRARDGSSRRVKMVIRNAAVLPVPVCAWPATSLPASASGSALLLDRRAVLEAERLDPAHDRRRDGQVVNATGRVVRVLAKLPGACAKVAVCVRAHKHSGRPGQSAARNPGINDGLGLGLGLDSGNGRYGRARLARRRAEIERLWLNPSPRPSPSPSLLSPRVQDRGDADLGNPEGCPVGLLAGDASVTPRYSRSGHTRLQ